MNFAVDGTVAALVAIIVQMLLKPLIEAWLAPTAPNHDTVIRAVALLLGVVLVAVTTLVGGPWPANGNAWLMLFGSGALSGLVAIGGYHALTGSATPPGTVSGLPVNIAMTEAPRDDSTNVKPAPTNVNFPAYAIPQPAQAPIEHVVTVKVAQPDAKIIDVVPAPAVTGGEAAAGKLP